MCSLGKTQVKISPQRLISFRLSVKYRSALSELVENREASVYNPLPSLFKGVGHHTAPLMNLFLTVILSDQVRSYGTFLGHNNGVFYFIC